MFSTRSRSARASTVVTSRSLLAKHYGVEERTIKTWREKGLPGVRVGKVVMFDVEQCDSWIEGQGG
jgi:phage terminase Nu1 subunit (DNA packaging protein)